MNNTKYIDWICDVLGYQALAGREISSIQINFDREARPDEDVCLFCGTEDDGTVAICGKDAVDQRMVFESRLTLK